jgi:hypothetical protein
VNKSIEQGTEAVASSVSPNNNGKQHGIMEGWKQHRREGETSAEKQSKEPNLGPSGACAAARNRDHVIASFYGGCPLLQMGTRWFNRPMSRFSSSESRGCPRVKVRWAEGVLELSTCITVLQKQSDDTLGS